MRQLFNKSQVLTIPNLLTLIRLLLIPVIIWLYCVKKEYYLALGTIVFSGITDVVDGIIARKCNMVTDLGKIIDPIADKLTQGVIILCLLTKYYKMWILIVIFVVGEVIKFILGYFTIAKKDQVHGANWYGKVNTVALYLGLGLLILLPNMGNLYADLIIYILSLVNLCCFALYAVFYIRVLKK